MAAATLGVLLFAATPSFAWEDDRTTPTGALSDGGMTGVDALFEQLAVVKQAVTGAFNATVEKNGGAGSSGTGDGATGGGKRGEEGQGGAPGAKGTGSSSGGFLAVKNISVSDRVGETSAAEAQSFVTSGGSASATTGPSDGAASPSGSTVTASSDLGLNVATEAFRKLNARMGASTQTIGGMVDRARAFNRTGLNPTGADPRENRGGSPNDGKTGTTFGTGRNELTMGNIASNNKEDETDWGRLTKKLEAKKDAKDKDKDANKKDKKQLTEEERKELKDKMDKLEAKAPPFNPQDYLDAGNVLMKLGENGGLSEEFIAKAKQIYGFTDPGSGRALPDTDETPDKQPRVTAYQNLFDKSGQDVFQTPVTVGTPAPHQERVHR